MNDTEYSERFDALRKNRVELSFYKYGSAKRNFGERLTNALGSFGTAGQKGGRRYENTYQHPPKMV